jgi:hypothetical protein
LGFFAKDEMAPEFSDAAFKAKVGSVVGPVVTQFGFHIIKVESHEMAVVVSLESASNEIAEKMLHTEQSTQLADKVAKELHAGLTAGKKLEDLKGAHRLTWEYTGKVALNARYLPGLGAKQELLDGLGGLSASKPLSPVIRSGKAFYILKRHAYDPIDKKTLTAEKKKQMAASGAMAQSYTLFNELQSLAHKEYEQRQRIYLNPQYLALDAAKSAE